MPIFKFTNNSNSYGGAPHEVEEHKTMLKIDALEAEAALILQHESGYTGSYISNSATQ